MRTCCLSIRPLMMIIMLFLLSETLSSTCEVVDNNISEIISSCSEVAIGDTTIAIPAPPSNEPPPINTVRRRKRMKSMVESPLKDVKKEDTRPKTYFENCREIFIKHKNDKEQSLIQLNNRRIQAIRGWSASI